MYNTPLHYGSYVYPRWGKALGVCMGATCCLQILIWAIVAISRETGTLKDVSTTYYILLRHPVSVRSGYTSATVRNNNTLLLLFTYRRRQMKWNLLCRRVSDCLLGFFFFLLQRFQKSIRPLNSWRVNNLNSAGRVEEHMEPDRVEAPFTVTLTDMDFTAMRWEMGSQAWQHGEQRRTQCCQVTEEFIMMLFAPARLWRLNRLCVLQGSVY